MTNKLVRHQILEGNIHDPHLHTVAALGIFFKVVTKKFKLYKI